MRRLYFAGVILSLFGVLALNTAGAEDAKEPKYTIKEVMKLAHKEGLLKKVTEGKATKDEAAQLAELYDALGQNKPPQGDETSWKEKTVALLAAAKGVTEGKDGAAEKLKASANCANCHKAHKPS